MKLTKGDLNILLNEIERDNPVYGLIYKLIYVYGKTANMILLLKRNDVDFDQKTITFKDTQFPLLDELAEKLKNINLGNEEYFFLNIENDDEKREIDILRKRLVNYLKSHTKQLDLPLYIKKVSLSITELRRLRGQHLVLDGVDFNVIKQLYLQGEGTTTQFKKYLEYDELQDSLIPCKDLDTLFDDYTDFNIFDFEDYDNSLVFFVTVDSDFQFPLIIDDRGYNILDEVDDDMKDLIDKFYRKGLLSNLHTLKPYEYKDIEGIWFSKI